MGTLAFLRDSTTSSPVIERCHVNLWCVGGFRQRAFLFDMGIEFSALAGETVSEIHTLLPFGTSLPPQDLSHHFRNSTTSELLFGARVETTREAGFTKLAVHDEEAAEPAGRQLFVATASAHGVEDDELRRHGSSLWTIKVTPALRPNHHGYVRLRFRLAKPAPLWTWAPGDQVAAADVRVSDLRELIFEKGERTALAERFLEIRTMNVMIIAPIWMYLEVVRPDLRYIRLAEGKAWADYLERSVDFFERDKLAIYYWRKDQPVDASGANPERMFLLLRRTAHAPSLWRFAATAGAAILGGATVWALTRDPNLGDQVIASAGAAISWAIGPVTIIGLVVFGVRLLTGIRQLRPWRDAFSLTAARLEESIYHARWKL